MPTRNQWWALVLVSLITTLTFVTIPRYPYLIDDQLSQTAVLSYAHQHGLQFGKDIVFTYGPLGFLINRHFYSHAANLRMATDFMTCFGVASGVALVAWRLNRIWRWLLLALFIFLSSNIDPRADLVLYIGFFCWGLLCFLESGGAFVLCCTMFAGFGVFSVLVKANFLILIGFTATLVILDRAIQKKFRVAAAMLFGVIVSFFVGWLLAGQYFSNLKAFLFNLIPLVSDYDQTMVLEGIPALQQRGWITLPIIFAVAIIRTLTAFSKAEKGVRSRRIILFAWIMALVFIVLKHGFVRAGLFHGGFYFGLIPIVAVALDAVPSESTKTINWTRGLGILCCVICILSLESFFFPGLKASLGQPFRAIPANLRALLKPGQYQGQMLESQQSLLTQTQLPRTREIVENARIDVFGQDQVYAVLNGLNYRPRPIFQSFAAYSTALMRMNEQFYFSKAAPEYVLFRLTPIDRRFAPLEDSTVLRDLLINYEPVEGENQFLLLKRKPAAEIPRLTLSREGISHPNEPISLNEFSQSDLWLQIDVKPNLLGRARKFFYKPPIVRLAMWRDSSKKAFSRFRAPAPMLAAGFVASPMLANTEDTINLYADCAVTRPYACSVELGDGNDCFWQKEIHYRIYKIEGTLGRNAHDSLPRLLTYAGFQIAPTEIVSSSNAFVRVQTQPAFFLPIGGSIRFIAPKGTRMIEGKFGLGSSDPNVEPADFRIEEEMPDGSNQTLQSQVPNPSDYGLKPFAIPLTPDNDHKLILRTALATDAPPAKGQLEKKQPLSCWADVRFN